MMLSLWCDMLDAKMLVLLTGDSGMNDGQDVGLKGIDINSMIC